jgi:hypothetical protein
MKLACCLPALLLLAMTTLAASPRADLWQKVEAAKQQGLPRTALETLEPLLRAALAERAWAEAARALCQKIALEADLEGGKPEEKITRLAAALTTLPAELRPLLETVLAHWYWQYFQQNRWRFLQRTATAQPPGADFTTWDLPRLFAEIDRHFTAALAAADQLQRTPVSAFDEFLVKGALPDTYRPTLYDFLAHQALAFYTAGEQAGARPQDAFQIAATDPIFDPPNAFLAWRPQTTETNAAALRAVQLYQDLLRSHQNDPDRTAFLDVDLARLLWGKNAAAAEGRAERFKAALLRFAGENAAHELSALALYHLAVQWRDEGNPAEAHRLATRGRDTHPESPGGKLCANLIAEIEAPHVNLTTERVWNCGRGLAATNEVPCPVITIRYRNLTQLRLRAVAWDWDEFLDRNRPRPEHIGQRELRELLARPAAREWPVTLPPTPDFKTRTLELPAPTDLPPGFYFIVASHDPGFRETDNQLAVATCWVSDLALVVRNRAGRIEGFVLDDNRGEPLPGARVQGWYLNSQGNRVAVPDVQTDPLGFFTLAAPEQHGVLIKATLGNRAVATAEEHHAWRFTPPTQASTRTVFFTDRAIYRPGQTIRYKGICLRADPARDNYEVLPGQRLTVVFYDANNQEVARQEFQANDYGAFSGSFTAPSGRRLGPMRLEALRGPAGSVAFSVEEYKRPKFQVTLEAPKVAAKLNAEVRLAGQATAYTGAAIDHALVRYRVVRQVQMPWWWDWGWFRRPRPRQADQEIAHGELRTDAVGRFEIAFLARPDPTVPESDEPTFQFTVHADVTDSTGETRSDARTLRLGYSALEARLSADEWLTADRPVRLEVRTTSLDGEAQVAAGVLRLHSLQAPERVQRPRLGGDFGPVPRRWPAGPEADPAGEDSPENPDGSDPNQWPLGPVLEERAFSTDTNGLAVLDFRLPAGVYRAVLETQDRYGRRVSARLPLTVVDPASDRFDLKVPYHVSAPRWEVQPGEEFLALWGTGYPAGRAFIEIEHRGRLLQRYWTAPGATQARIRQAVTEAMRGGFNLLVTFVHDNRAHFTLRQVRVPWRDRELSLRWVHFTSKLQPGQKETWTLEVRGSGAAEAERRVAELVATLYDASLDAFAPLSWPAGFEVFREEPLLVNASFANRLEAFRALVSWARKAPLPVELTYRDFPPEVRQQIFSPLRMMMRYGLTVRGAPGGELPEAMTPAAPAMAAMVQEAGVAGDRLAAVAADAAKAAPDESGTGGAAPRGPDLSRVAPRKNLNETAFFFPHLRSDSNGTVRLEFTLPEALTEWRFLGFAHDRQLRAGRLEGRAVTSRDLMVQPNPPRFLREGDVVEFTVKVSNQSDQPQRGRVRLNLRDGLNDAPADPRLGNLTPEQAFDIPARQSRSFAWRLSVPDGLAVLTYRAVAAGEAVEDGEEGFVPVLARRVLVTESLPLPIRGPATNRFHFAALAESGRSPTLVHQSLTVQMVSQPAWYAVLALPYLMEFPHECAEQVFNRYYANALARHIARSDPKIRRIFDLWKATPALDSPLEKNPELKAVALEESPWLQQARAESQARRNVGVLFDDNRLAAELAAALDKLRETRRADGGWAWFPGGPRDDYITLYIVTGFGRLRHLGVDASVDLAVEALDAVDRWVREQHRRILDHASQPEEHVPDALEALYLYGRSFFLREKPLAPETQTAVDFFLARARAHWLKTGSRQTQGHLALALQRFGDTATAQAIARSLKERSVTSEELGRFWRDPAPSWWWYHAPLETHALMMEVLAEIAQDAAALEECQVWLLKQKQTQHWKSTKATADAVYALLLRGRNLLSSDALVGVALGDLDLTPGAEPPPGPGLPRPAVEPGTGFYEVRLPGSAVRPEWSTITVRKTDPGVAWGSVHWQYFEDLSRIPPFAETPLRLTKRLFVRRLTARGPVLEAVSGPVAVGDELVVRLELRVDRDMEYVHLKDARGSGTEPVNVLSGYRYQDGLGYYETTRDTASHFFIGWLPRGTYVFEYPVRVQLRGEYQTGPASIQCLYAPEFNSHSESFKLVVR